MKSLLSLFTGSWKKNGNVASAAPPPVVPVPAVPDFAPTALEERQRLLAHHVRLVARGMANGLCVYGSRGGLGKTRVVLETLKEEGVEPVILTGHCTPLAMYMSLYEHPESVVFLDDCDAMFRNLPALGILRSALWEGEKGNRLVNYNSSQLKIPSSFRFKGRVIFAVNALPRQNHAFGAVLSRVDQFELSASNEEVLVMLRQLAAQGFEGADAGRVPGGRGLHRGVLGEPGAVLAAAGTEPAESHLRAGSERGLAAARRQPAPRDRSNRCPQGLRLPRLRPGMPATGHGGLSPERR